MTEIIDFGAFSMRFLYDKYETGGSFDMFEMTVPPGQRMPLPHYHENWDETVYAVSGTVTFTVAGQPHELQPGSALLIPRGVVHGFDNRGGTVATCLCVLTPGVLGSEYFRELAALISTGQPDPAKVREIMLRHGLVPG